MRLDGLLPGNRAARVARVAKAGRLSPDVRARVARIEAERSRMALDSTPSGPDPGEPTVGEMVRRSSVKQDKARLLLAAVAQARPGHVLELGTCCGLSGAYLLAGLPEGSTLRSLEGAPVLAQVARDLWARLGHTAGEVVTGDFADTFEASLDPAPDLAFVDGNHHEEPTWRYFEALAKVCPPGALLLFDDIWWSDGMRRVWGRISADPRVRWSFTSTGLGIVVLG